MPESSRHACPCTVYVCRWPALCIHGDKQQQERDFVLQGMCTAAIVHVWFTMIFCQAFYCSVWNCCKFLWLTLMLNLVRTYTIVNMKLSRCFSNLWRKKSGRGWGICGFLKHLTIVSCLLVYVYEWKFTFVWKCCHANLMLISCLKQQPEYFVPICPRMAKAAVFSVGFLVYSKYATLSQSTVRTYVHRQTYFVWLCSEETYVRTYMDG